MFTMASSHATWISHARGISAVVHEALDQRQLLLASLPPSQLQNRLACGIVVTMLVLFVVTLRYVNVQLPRVDAFIPIHAITTLINDLITAGLLFSQYSIERRRTLLVLASGYLFTCRPGCLRYLAVTVEELWYGTGGETGPYLRTVFGKVRYSMSVGLTICRVIMESHGSSLVALTCSKLKYTQKS